MTDAKKHLHVYIDGGARGNPGPSGIGVVILDSAGNRLRELSKSIGCATNNVAEYTALVYGLQEALAERADEIDLYMDSELVSQQISGLYKVKSENIRPLFEQAIHLLKMCGKVKIHHIPREKNKEADKLVNKAINLSGLF